jgi:hypothetical protein
MSNKGIAALALGLLVAFGMIIAGAMMMARNAVDQRREREAARRVELEEEQRLRVEVEREEGRVEAAAVFADPARPAPADEAEFAAVFDHLGGTLARGDIPAVGRAFDVDRLVTELERIRAFDRLPGNGRPEFREGMRKGVGGKIGEMLGANETVRWNRTDVRHVRWSADRHEVVVIAVHWNGEDDDVPFRCRWWLIRRPGGWKIYDFEELDMGMRLTRTVASLATPEILEGVARDPLPFQKATVGLREAIALLSRGDAVGADVALAPARVIPWPTPVRAVLEFVEGMILMGKGDPAAALARLEEAERLLPNMPANTLARGLALAALGRPEEALEAARKYRKEVGPDAMSFTLEGTALEGQGKTAEAAEAFRRALDEAPTVNAFHGLRRVLPDANKGELGERLARAKNPQKLYDELAPAARLEGDTKAADALLDGLIKARPGSPRAMAEDIRRKVEAAQFSAAVELLNRGLKAKEEADRDTVLDAYLSAMFAAGKPVDAYAAVPKALAGRAFRSLAEDLDDAIDDGGEKAADRSRQLTGLIAAHRKREPNDPWICFYEAAAFWHAKDYEKAEQVLALGATKLPARPAAPDNENGPDIAERFRERRVECLFKLNKGLAAYRDIAPAGATFRQLANMYDNMNDLAGLAELLAAHRRAKQKEPEGEFWEAHLRFRKDDLAGAIPLYKSYLRDAGEQATRLRQARDELIRALVRTAPADAKRMVRDLDPDDTSTALRAAVAAANGDRVEVERLLEESARNGKTWFYADADFRRFIGQEKYRDLRAKYPDPNPPPKVEG